MKALIEAFIEGFIEGMRVAWYPFCFLFGVFLLLGVTIGCIIGLALGV